MHCQTTLVIPKYKKRFVNLTRNAVVSAIVAVVTQAALGAGPGVGAQDAVDRANIPMVRSLHKNIHHS